MGCGIMQNVLLFILLNCLIETTLYSKVILYKLAAKTLIRWAQEESRNPISIGKCLEHGGKCPGWELSGMGNVHCGEVSGMGNVRDGKCPGREVVGYVRDGKCPGWEVSGIGSVWEPLFSYKKPRDRS